MSVADRLRLAVVSGLGTGLLPWAPGTWASGAAAALWLAAACGWGSLGWPLAVWTAAGMAAAGVGCVALGRWAIARAGRADPSFVVIDEFAGQWLSTLPPMALLGGLGCGKRLAALAAGQFVLFRLFDIAKPWPCRPAERLPAGWGILADDLLAGLYAGLIGLSGWAVAQRWLCWPT